MSDKKPSRLSQFFHGLTRFVDAPWYLPLMCFLAALDLFVIVIPVEGVMIPGVMVRPKRWILMAVVMALGSAIGALALALVIEHYGISVLQQTLGDPTQSPNWIRVENWVHEYGALAMFGITLSVIPQHTGIILCALSGVSAFSVFLAVWIGRIIKYCFFAYLAKSGSPWLLSTFKIELPTVKDLPPTE